MTVLEQLKEKIAKRLPDLDVVIAWGEGFDALHRAPLFIRGPGDLEKLRYDPLCVHNLATYLTRYKNGTRIGVVVKGCDSRSVVQMLQEKLVNREKIVVFGVPCEGVADLGKIKLALAEEGLEIGRVKSCAVTDEVMKLTVSGREVELDLEDVLADKCGRCPNHDAVISDEFAGEPTGRKDPDTFADVEAFESLTLEERMEFWREQMDRCLRCYACRNACPLCVCRDHCIAQSREPGWVSQRDGLEEKFFFQMIHAMHLAGRCTECGECQRACPVDIPLMVLKRQLAKDIHDLFEYRSGTDPEVKPPLLSFKVEEDTINERGW